MVNLVIYWLINTEHSLNLNNHWSGSAKSEETEIVWLLVASIEIPGGAERHSKHSKKKQHKAASVLLAIMEFVIWLLSPSFLFCALWWQIFIDTNFSVLVRVFGIQIMEKYDWKFKARASVHRVSTVENWDNELNAIDWCDNNFYSIIVSLINWTYFSNLFQAMTNIEIAIFSN